MSRAHAPVDTPVFLMSPPRRDWRLQGRSNFRSRGADEVDPDEARSEWTALADGIVEAGGEVLVCPPNPRRNETGMIYTAEAGEFYRDASGAPRFLLPNMAVDHRRREADWLGGFMQGLGITPEAVEARWEAQGDAIRGTTPDQIVHTYGRGPDGRTEPEAYPEVADKLSARHLQIEFRADPWFHGNTFLNVYRAPSPDHDPQAIVLVCPEALSEGEFTRLTAFLDEPVVVTISREESLAYDTNALQVNETVLAPEDLSTTAGSALRELGLTIERLDLGELFQKGGGAPVCLTNRLWGLEAGQLPDRLLWSHAPALGAHTKV